MKKIILGLGLALALSSPGLANPLVYIGRPYSGPAETCAKAVPLSRMAIQCRDARGRDTGIRTALDRDPEVVQQEEQAAMEQAALRRQAEAEAQAQQQQREQQIYAAQMALIEEQRQAVQEARNRAAAEQIYRTGQRGIGLTLCTSVTYGTAMCTAH